MNIIAQVPAISMKEIFKFLINIQLCNETKRTLEQNQDGILVNVFFEHDCEKEEIERLKAVHPDSFSKCSTKKG